MNLADVTKHCSYLLRHSPEAEECLNYLDNRINRETQELFGFGFIPGTTNINLLTDYINELELTKLGLLYGKNIGDWQSIRKLHIYFFENHPLIMPYRDVYGNVVALVARSLLDDKNRTINNVAKYKNTVFTKGNHVYGLYEAKEHIMKAGFVYVVEGQFDVIKSFEKGLKNIVALGNSNMTGYQLSLISRYTNNIIFLLDNDDAGNIGRKRAQGKFGKLVNLNVNTYLPNGYKDICDYFQDHDLDTMSLITRNIKNNLE